MLKFLVFADLHYKKKMYAPQVEDLQAILDRAAAENVDFVIHVGDFCNDYMGSTEILNAYLHNSHGLPVYGIYGNHELETPGNTMDVVTPRLCNREVRFGGPGYWWADIRGYRILGLDTNYSWSEERSRWEHNAPASWGAPVGNRTENSLGPQQLAWLDQVLSDAAEGNQKVIVFSHAGLSDLWDSSPDAKTVRDFFAKYGGTVLLSVNGHLHTDHFAVADNVAYFDVNTAINGYWRLERETHYDDAHTFEFHDFDGSGRECGVRDMKLNDLVQGKNTWSFESPLSAVVTVWEDGAVTVEGSKTAWQYGVVPENMEEGVMPEIRDRTVTLAV